MIDRKDEKDWSQDNEYQLQLVEGIYLDWEYYNVIIIIIIIFIIHGQIQLHKDSKKMDKELN